MWMSWYNFNSALALCWQGLDDDDTLAVLRNKGDGLDDEECPEKVRTSNSSPVNTSISHIDLQQQQILSIFIWKWEIVCTKNWQKWVDFW